MAIVEFRRDDILRLRKQHPCGGSDWRVHRIGADIGLTCTTCARRILLARPVLEKRMKTFVSRGPAAAVDPPERPGG